MRSVRRVFRILLLAPHVLLGLALAHAMGRTRSADPPTHGQWGVIQWWLRRAGRIFGLRVTVGGKAPREAILAVANHISWLDILVVSSVLPVCFVSKAEVRNWPIVGTLAGSAGTLFLKRGGRDAASQATMNMGEYLTQGQSVLIFPEATTGDGHSVHRFHARLFGAAIETGARVLPVALSYPHSEGVNPVVPFIGRISFGGHAWRVLGENRIDARVNLLEPIAAQETDRRGVATQAHDAIEAVIIETTVPGGP